MKLQSVAYKSYRVFHGFWQAKFSDGGSVLGSSQFLILPQLPPKILLDSKVLKINPKIIIWFRLSKSMTHFVATFFGAAAGSLGKIGSSPKPKQQAKVRISFMTQLFRTDEN